MPQGTAKLSLKLVFIPHCRGYDYSPVDDKEVYWTAQANLGHKQAGNNLLDTGSQGEQAGKQWKSGLLEPA